MSVEHTEFISHLEDGMPELTKAGSGIRSALLALCKAAAAEHAEMSGFHKKIHDSMDDGHEQKALHGRLSGHHAAKAASYGKFHKALTGEDLADGDVHTGVLHGPSKSMRDQIRPDGVRVIAGAPHIKLVPRSGSNAGGDVAVDPALDDMFSGV